MRRLVPSIVALGALALSLYAFAWALYVATVESVDLSRNELIVELWIAAIGVAVGIAATISASRAPFPDRSFALSLSALAVGGIWYVFVFQIAVR